MELRDYIRVPRKGYGPYGYSCGCRGDYKHVPTSKPAAAGTKRSARV